MPHNAIFNHQIISIDEAIKGETYLCPDCHEPLKVKRGLIYRPHFYHIQKKNCTRYNHQEHLAVQSVIKRLIPSAKLEVIFPSINRIADIVWEEKKLIFEVQVSPITLQELTDRNYDYASQGYTVVWLFHTKNFNKRKVKPAEKYARSKIAYYTNINNSGYGTIFDQHLKRRFVTERYPIDISQPYPTKQLPHHYGRRDWPYFFRGDVLDQIARGQIDPITIKSYFPQTLSQLKFDTFLRWLGD